jgi:hypothetical protein
VQVKANIKEEEPLVKDFVDQTFWKVDIYQDKSVDDLMAEMEL